MRYAIFFALCCLLMGYAALLAFDSIFHHPADNSLVRSINDYRNLSGISALRYDTRLACAAQAHAYEMHQMSACLEVGRLGVGARKRAEDCEYPFSEGQLLVVCQPKGPFDLLHVLKEKYHDSLLQYRYVGTAQFLTFHVVFLAN